MILPRDSTFYFILLSSILLVGFIEHAHSIDKELRSGVHNTNNNNYGLKNNNHIYLDTLKHDNGIPTDFTKKSHSDPFKRFNTKNTLLKSTGDPKIQWAQSFGTLGDDTVQSILADSNGNVYMTGVFTGNLTVAGFDSLNSNGGYDFFVMKIAFNGTVESIFSFGGAGDDWANAMDWSPDGKFSGQWTAGDYNLTSTNYNDSDIFIMKMTTQGDVIWVLPVGGPADDNADDVAVLNTGVAVVVGSFQQYIDFGALGSMAVSNGADDMLILWIHQDGIVMTYKNYGSTGPDTATGVALSVSLGQIGVCAVYNGPMVIETEYHTAVGADVVIILYWDNATYIDSTSFGSGVDDGFEDVVVDTAGNVYVVGYYTDGAVAAVGMRDIVIIKFTESASFLWYKLFGGPQDDIAYAIAVDEKENVFIVGATGGGINFGSGPLETAGSADIFALTLDPDGNLLVGDLYGGTGNDTGREVAVVNGAAIIAGTFDGPLTLGSSSFTPLGGTDIVLFQTKAVSSSSGGKKNNVGAIVAGVLVPIFAIAILAALLIVFLKRRAAYRKNVLDMARASEIKIASTPENNYQPVMISSENASNQSLNFSMASHNLSNQSIQNPDSNYSAMHSSSLEHQYEGIGSHIGSGVAMSPEIMEMIKAQGINDISNSSWLIDFKQIQIQQKIGSGAFGAVFKAVWRGVPVAVKQSQTEMAIQDFISEAEILQKLRPHPNITQFLGICPQPFCLVFEFVPNGSLFSFLMNKSKAMDNPLKIRILRGVVAGMIHLHSEGIVHRDLAARNILLDGTFTPKVCDFGLSRATGGATMGHTASEIGPIKWMAPEAILKRIYSPKTDIWSFGVVIFEVLERQVPYPDLSVPQVAAYITQISLTQSIPEENNHPKPLVDMMKECLQVDPEKRPSFETLIKEFDEKLPQEH